MIGRLSGILAEVGEEEAIIDCGGVGYIVRLGARALSRLLSSFCRDGTTLQTRAKRATFFFFIKNARAFRG